MIGWIVLNMITSGVRDIALRLRQPIVIASEIAGYKLGAFGLDEFVDLDIGGYGSVSEYRVDVVADAVRRAGHKHGVGFAPARPDRGTGTPAI